MLRDLMPLLEAHYGTPGTEAPGGPLEMILWENVAYLVNDERRRRTFESFKHQIGTNPDQIAAASFTQLQKAIQDGGIILDKRVEKLSKIGKLVMEEFGGDLNSVLSLPVIQAKKALQLFPGIGEPVAEKILLFCRKLPCLAVDSNGLRALLRLGFGSEQKYYRATYRSVQEAVKSEIVDDFDWLIRAHHLLRIHGQQICKQNAPRCKDCPVRLLCPYPTHSNMQGRV
jgi:endonuclease-3